MDDFDLLRPAPHRFAAYCEDKGSRWLAYLPNSILFSLLEHPSPTEEARYKAAVVKKLRELMYTEGPESNWAHQQLLAMGEKAGGYTPF